MASQAEVDLIVNAADALPQLQRDLARVVTTAQAGMDDVDIAATLDTGVTVRNLIRDLDRAAAAAADGADDIDMQAVLNQRATLTGLLHDLDRVANAASRGDRDEIALRGVLDVSATLPQLQADLRRAVRTAERTAPEIDIEIDTDRLTRFAGQIGSAIGPVAGLAARLSSLGLAAGAAVPVLAGVAAAAQQIAPAAAVGTQALLAMQLATGTLKLGLLGVQDALTAAFDPNADPEKLQKALEQLSPAARKFVVQLQDMKDEFKDLQLGVQDRLFRNLADGIRPLANAVLPDVTDALNDTADSLNAAAVGAAQAAIKLGENGTLGKALDGASKGLSNLEGIPARVVTALGQLAAASAPAFDRITQVVDRASVEISDRLNSAFESGALEDSINAAIDAVKQLGEAGQNVFSGLRNIISGVTVDGGSLFDRLVLLTQAFEDLTASKEFQTILGELSATADTLVKNVLPLLQEAFKQLAPVIEILGPPVRDFLNAIGPELQDVIKELGPVLVDLAIIFRDQMPTAIEFAKAALHDISLILRALDELLDTFVIPTLRAFADAMDSDVVKAAETMSSILTTTLSNLFTRFDTFRQNTIGSLSNFSDGLGRIAVDAAAKFVDGMLRLIDDTRNLIGDLPGIIRGALGDLGGLLFNAGESVISGFIDGIQSRIGEIASTLGGITDRLPDWKGPQDVDKSILFESGKLVMQGFQAGINSQLGSLQNQLGGITGGLPGMTVGGIAPVSSTVQPQITVMIGNEEFRGFVDTRVTMANSRNTRIAAQGVRR